MDNKKLSWFRNYYNNRLAFAGANINLLDDMYKKFGHKFICDLPIEYVYGLPLVCGIIWCHNTSDVALYHDGVPLFYILGCQLSLDEWLPRSSLSSEEQLVFKLKYE